MIPKTTRSALLGLAVTAALTGTNALHAQEGALTQEMAERIQSTIRLVPSSDGSAPDALTVRIEDGMYVVAGLVEGMGAKNDVRSALEGIDGLDMGLLVNNVTVQ